MEIRFTQAARKHRIGRASVRHVMAHTAPTGTITDQGSPGWRYVGVDERDRELEVVAIEINDNEEGEAFLLVIHAMPTQLRGSDPHV